MAREKVEQRLEALKAEYEAGQKMLADLDAKRASLTQTLLRIEGAIQVLREMLDSDLDAPKSPNEAGPAT